MSRMIIASFLFRIFSQVFLNRSSRNKEFWESVWAVFSKVLQRVLIFSGISSSLIRACSYPFSSDQFHTLQFCIEHFWLFVTIDRWVSEGWIPNSCDEEKMRTSSLQTDVVNGENRALVWMTSLGNALVINPFVRTRLKIYPFRNLSWLDCLVRSTLYVTFRSEFNTEVSQSCSR